jgi:uncharacterized protein (TIGR02466 family)
MSKILSMPLDERSAAYTRMADALSFLGDTWPDQPDLATCAAAVGLSPTHFQREFSRWAGLSPKQYQSALAHGAAGEALREGASVLEASFEAGLSGPGRLHDLFIAHEGLTPGEAKSGGEGITLNLGKAPTPFGMGLWLMSPRGLVALGFIDENPPERTGFEHQGRREADAVADLKGRYPGARVERDDHAALTMALEKDPTVMWEPAGKATRKGGQTGLLLDDPREPFIAFEKTLRRAIDTHFDSIKVQPKHPYFGQVPKTYHLDLWGTLLSEGGHQHSHIHVGGWMSGVYYVSLPPSLGKGDGNMDGWIEFGHPPPDFESEFAPHTITLDPREGDAFFFPSYIFHRTLPFSGSTRRISLAFDVKPTSWR